MNFSLLLIQRLRLKIPRFRTEQSSNFRLGAQKSSPVVLSVWWIGLSFFAETLPMVRRLA